MKTNAVASVLFASLTSVCTSPAASLIVNGGFEDGLRGWTATPAHTVANAPGCASEGIQCVTAELDQPNKALSLRQDVQVRAGCAYELGMSVRGKPGLRFGFFGVFPDRRTRERIETWEELTPKWQRHVATFSPETSGTLKLEVIAPSTFGGTQGGRIWIDDITLTETVLPKFVDVSARTGFNDEPAMVRATDGSIYVSWISFREGRDTLQLARFVDENGAWTQRGTWTVALPEPVYALQPHLAAGAGRVALLVACEIQKNWEIVAIPCTTDGPGKVTRIGSHTAVDIKASAAYAPDGHLWIAWESNRGGRRSIQAVSVGADGTPGAVEALSADSFNAYSPSLAVTAAGHVHVAWHDFRAGRCDIQLRTRSPMGTWGEPRTITRAPAIDRHAQLVARGDDLWLLYETAQVNEYHIGATSGRKVRLAKIAADGLLAPKSQNASPLEQGAENPAAVFDADGRLWVAFLRAPGPKAGGWQTLLTCFTGDRWIPAVTISRQKGMDRRPSLFVAGNSAVVCGQADNMPHSWTNEAASADSRSDIWLAAQTLDGPPPAVAPSFGPFTESAEAFAPIDLRAARGEDRPPSTIEYGGKTLKLFFGDLHHHTDVSPCGRVRDQSIDEGYQHMRDLAVHDFACATDHGYGINAYLWNYTAKLARANEDPGRYLTFLAEEWTSTFEEYSVAHPYGFYGHRNLILSDTYFPRWWNAKNRQTPAQVWEDLRRMNANFVHIPHQIADTGNVPCDWNFADEKAQPVAEIFQTRGSYEHPGAPRAAKNTTPKGWFLQDAWARGIVIGVIASPDHGGGYGKACVYAPELTREAILDALRARRCYGTTAAKIVLDVRVAGRLMGEKASGAPPAEVPVEVRVSAPADLARAEVCRNNEFVYSKDVTGRECSFTFTDRAPVAGRSYYYVRVVQKDDEVAWSSPVWFGAP